MGRHRGCGRSRRHGVDADPERTERACQRAHQAEDRGLRGDVGRSAASVASDPSDGDRIRGGEHDRSVALRLHCACARLADQEGAHDVDGHDPGKFRRVELPPGRARMDRCHMHERIEPSEALQDGLHSGAATFAVRDVEPDAEMAGALRQWVFRPRNVRRADRVSLRKKSVDAGAPDAARGAGDQCHLLYRHAVIPP